VWRKNEKQKPPKQEEKQEKPPKTRKTREPLCFAHAFCIRLLPFDV